ncbi:MAG: NUDIX hydrolase [Pseudomonadota bacterium]
MTLEKFEQSQLRLKKGQNEDARSQFGAVCYRLHKGKPQVLLITSRRSGRWVIPKGWPMPGETPSDAAATEAWEEAGVEGRVHPLCLGIFSYRKFIDRRQSLPCAVAVFGLRVKRLARRFPEQGQRKRKWVSPKRAAQMVDEPELSQLLERFDPRGLPI